MTNTTKLPDPKFIKIDKTKLVFYMSEKFTRALLVGDLAVYLGISRATIIKHAQVAATSPVMRTRDALAGKSYAGGAGKRSRHSCMDLPDLLGFRCHYEMTPRATHRVQVVSRLNSLLDAWPKPTSTSIPLFQTPAGHPNLSGAEAKAARESNGLSQNALAELLGVKRSAIAHFEQGRSAHPETVQRVSDYFRAGLRNDAAPRQPAPLATTPVVGVNEIKQIVEDAALMGLDASEQIGKEIEAVEKRLTALIVKSKNDVIKELRALVASSAKQRATTALALVSRTNESNGRAPAGPEQLSVPGDGERLESPTEY